MAPTRSVSLPKPGTVLFYLSVTCCLWLITFTKYAAPFAIRSLGHATLCGVLHVVYQSKSGVGGDYMLCALFRTCLIMAMPKISSSNYDIVVDIGLGDLRVDRTNNGRGKQNYHRSSYID